MIEKHILNKEGAQKEGLEISTVRSGLASRRLHAGNIQKQASNQPTDFFLSLSPLIQPC